MYTGIIKFQGSIQTVRDFGVGKAFIVRAPRAFLRRVHKADSVNIDGACFTVRKKTLRTFEVEAMPQTLRVTSVGSWREGQVVNLEPSVRLGEEMGGHFIYGHVDGVGVVDKIAREGRALLFGISLPEELMRYFPVRASISIDGVSLTVMKSEGHQIVVSLLPDTVEATSLGARQMNDKVNIEIDMLARYALEHA